MNFLNPFGLWLLLAVPVLIIAYIIRTQYEERPVSSTFIWKRSEALMRKKMPWQIFRRFFLFFMQLLTLICVALIAARPTMTVKGKGEEWVLIVDGSASMQTKNEEGITRFDRAITEAVELASDMKYGNKATVIYSGDSTAYKITRSEEALQVVNVLESLTCSNFPADFENALALARLIQGQNPYAKILYYTDKNHTEVSDVTVINVAEENEWNVAATGLSIADEGGGSTVFMSNIVSYGRDAEVTAALYVDGKPIDAKIISCKNSETQNVYWTGSGIKSFETAEIFIEAADGNVADNSYFLCNTPEEKKSVMLISAEPKFMQSILTAFEEFKVETYATLEAAYEKLTDKQTGEVPELLSGYDLYIFDGICPQRLPVDAPVWMFGVKEMPAELTVKADTNVPETDEAHKGLQPVADYMQFSNNESGKYYELLTRYIDHRIEDSDDEKTANDTNVALSYMVKYTDYEDYEVIFTCRDLPAMLVPKAYDNRYVIISFDIHDSNLPMLVDLPKLFNNMNAYCFPTMLSQTDFELGDAVNVSKLPKADSITLTYPDKSVAGLTPVGAPRTFTVDKPGLYTVTQKIKIGMRVYEETFDFYVHAPLSESDTSLEGGALVTANDSGAPNVGEGAGAIEIWIYIALALLVILIIEWWVYFREQY